MTFIMDDGRRGLVEGEGMRKQIEVVVERGSNMGEGEMEVAAKEEVGAEMEAAVGAEMEMEMEEAANAPPNTFDPSLPRRQCNLLFRVASTFDQCNFVCH